MAAAAALLAPIASANTVTVSSNANSGGGTLRALLATAGSGDTILVPGSFTITLASELDVTQAAPGVTISATGDGMPVLNGNHATRILHLNPSTALSLNGLHLTGGRVAGDGSAIQAFGPAALTVNNSVFTDNGSTSPSGTGGAVQVNGNVATTIQGSVFSANFAGSGSGNGGAIEIDSPNTANISKTTISGNQALGGRGGGIQMNGGDTLNISDSTVSGNTAGTQAGGIEIDSPGTLNMVNSTVTGNGAAGAGGGGIAFNSPGAGTVVNSTIAGNRATGGGATGGGLEIDSSTSNDVVFKNSIVAGNSAPNGANCGFPASTTPQFRSSGHNLENGTSCGFAAGGDLNADPLLASLADNGGTTQTMALLPGSPAIDHGDNVGCPATDQRGQVRPVDGGGGGLVCDIGAFEVAPSNAFRIAGHARCKTRRCAAIVVTVVLPGPGLLAAAGVPAGARRARATARAHGKSPIKPASRSVSAGGRLALSLKLAKAAQTKLQRKHKLRVAVRFTFTPTGGAANTKRQSLKITPKRTRRH
jgi:hypothetical protein